MGRRVLVRLGAAGGAGMRFGMFESLGGWLQG
jgi:hypothetical protein